ncbi:unnamed protein product [Paramecium pentaurelia]|uniref:Protein kinase domain-containing protein n=1 Tax=Paramecium pentaurelia TaxID=43138 RepID=A0A8S1UWQ4_9CILI|nr:unnamed protein product [Paramecium pentaurelia]
MQQQKLNQQPQNIKKIEGSSTSPYGKIKFENKQSQNSPSILKEIGQYVYNLNDVIGTGEFSSVYKGQDQNTNEIVAIKIIDRKSIQNNQIFRSLLVNEINILKSVDNKCLLKLYNYLETMNNIYIITEFCSDGDLQSIIEKKGYLPEHNAVKILKHLIKALLYLKERNIVHRDIKTQNILVSNQIPKLADFGFAIDLNQPQTKDILQIGTPLYMAPEIYSHYQYSSKTDLWALGIVFYEMLFGKVPFNAKNPKELEQMFQFHRKNQSIQYDNGPQKITEAAQDFLNSILVIDPKQRFDISQAANHPLIQNPHPHANKQN